MVSELSKIAYQFKYLNGSNHFPSLNFFTDERLSTNPEKTIMGLPKGAGVIFRHYGYRDRVKLAGVLRALCRKRGLIFIVSNDSWLADKIKADGIHLPEYQLKSPEKRFLLWKNSGRGFVSCAAHNKHSIRLAASLGVDAVFVSPVFQTNSHKDQLGMGVLRFRSVISNTTVPIYCLGGINTLTARQLRGSRVSGIGAIKALT